MCFMEKNEIKKLLYKEKPTAFLNYIRKGVAYYHTELGGKNIWFEIPVEDMGDADFGTTMDAKLLIRWLVE